MLLLRENRRWIRKSIDWTAILEISLGIFFYLGIAADSPAQIPASPPAKTEPTAKIDPLERETPRRAVIGFLKYSERQDFANAARYLQPTPGQDTNLVQRAKELQALHSRFRGDIGLLSDDPNGTVEVGLPRGQVRAGVLALGGTSTSCGWMKCWDSLSLLFCMSCLLWESYLRALEYTPSNCLRPAADGPNASPQSDQILALGMGKNWLIKTGGLNAR